MSIAENIIKYREQKKWSQKTLAEKAGISQASIHYWEKGERIPKSKSVSKLARALGVNYEDIDDTGETFITFKPQEINFSRLFAGVGGAIKDPILEDFFEEHIELYKNIIFEWADSRDYEFTETSTSIRILKNKKRVEFTDQDIDLLQDFIDNYLDVQLERKMKEI